MNCKSCSKPLSKNSQYCSHCGGKVVEDRLSLKGTWQEFVGPFFAWDHAFWRTFITLFTNPKDVLLSYVNGARKKYFQPFAYLILYATLLVFLYKFFPFLANFDTLNVSNQNGGSLPNLDQYFKSFDEYFVSYINILTILLIPFYALLSFLTFRKRGNNYAEHLVFNSYIQSNIGYATLPFIILISFFNFDQLAYYFLTLVSVIYTTYVFYNLYTLSTKQAVLAFLRYLLYIFVFSIIMGVIFIIIGIIIGLIVNFQS